MRYMLRYYPSTSILPFPYRCYTRESGMVTGTMAEDSFTELKSSIQKNGIVNPFIVEWFQMEGRNGASLCIRVGNNRAAALSQLGQEMAPVLFAVPAHSLTKLPSAQPRSVIDIPIDKDLLPTLRGLWSEVGCADDLPDAWMDSNLLLELVRRTMKDPNLLERRRSKNHEA